jgi:methoxymalonate biosynthesis acyl carrier protein
VALSEPGPVIRSFIIDRFPRESIADEDDIFSLGFVNSLFAMELVVFIERTFNFKIPNRELRLDNFRTISSMADLTRRQLAGVGRS